MPLIRAWTLSTIVSGSNKIKFKQYLNKWDGRKSIKRWTYRFGAASFSHCVTCFSRPSFLLNISICCTSLGNLNTTRRAVCSRTRSAFEEHIMFIIQIQILFSASCHNPFEFSWFKRMSNESSHWIKKILVPSARKYRLNLSQHLENVFRHFLILSSYFKKNWKYSLNKIDETKFKAFSFVAYQKKTVFPEPEGATK